MLSAPKLLAVRSLVETVPDVTIVGLSNALANTPPGGTLGPVREMVEAEAEERALRNHVLAPIVGLCREGRRVGRLKFPARALRRLWSGLKADSPGLVAQARSSSYFTDPETEEPHPTTVLNELCAIAGEGVRARSTPDFTAVAEVCDAAVPAGAEAMAGCLELAPVIRAALPHLDDWMRMMDDDSATQTRLAFRDAVNVSPDAGPRFVEMLAARLSPPGRTMRLLATVMDRPSESFLAASEMSGFAEDVLADIAAQMAVLRAFDLRRSPPDAARAAGRAVQEAATAISDFGDSVKLNREGPMGSRLIEFKSTLASLVEAKLDVLDDVVGAALPLESIRFAGRMTKLAPRLTTDPDPVLVQRAEMALIFTEQVRPAAGSGGFGSHRLKALEKVNVRLASYTDDLVLHLRGEDSENLGRAHKYLEVAAGFLALSSDEKAAQIVRRRAAA